MPRQPINNRPPWKWLQLLRQIQPDRLRYDLACIVEWDFLDKDFTEPRDIDAKKVILAMAHEAFELNRLGHAESTNDDMYAAMLRLGFSAKDAKKKLKPKSDPSLAKVKKRQVISNMRRRDCYAL